MKNIRNFCIIAHIDHGKSTLADRLLEKTNTLNQREMQSQVLDDMDLEREKGITIKSHAIQMEYAARDGERYVLNLIDTPGHVDFSYEVSRAIASCEGALLVVDATQGIQAQTISNLYLAVGHDLEIIPVLNKIDVDSAMIDEVIDQVIDLIGCKREDILLASGKTGQGVEEILEAIIARIPAPKGDDNAPLQALIFDSVFNPFRGIIAYFRVFNGSIRKGEHVKFINTGAEYDADEVGVLKLKMSPRDEIRSGDVGYICSGIKNSAEVKVGDTITSVAQPQPRGDRRLRGRQAHGLRRRLSRRGRPVRGFARFARKAATQRRLTDLRTGELAGARLRLPLRIPRTAAHGDHPGASLPRVRHGRHHHRAQRLVPHHHHLGRGVGGTQPLGTARNRRKSPRSRNPISWRRSSPKPTFWAMSSSSASTSAAC